MNQTPSTTATTTSSADSGYWDAMWHRQKLIFDENSIAFKGVFARHVARGGECLEIGCYPGGYLIHLSTRFDLVVSGVDSYPGMQSGFREHLLKNGAKVGEITCGDFFSFSPNRQFDLVCSFGFVEHFYDFRDILRRHAVLVKPGGLLIVTCPNFRKFQYLLHWILDRKNLNKHVIAAMDLEAWQRTLEECGLEVLEKGYHDTFLFWSDSESAWARVVSRWISRFSLWVNRKLRRPTSSFSPFMYCVARKTRT
jgi:cyclopropane fatty-acyl-phospholipid synthase-like methyltransferase